MDIKIKYEELWSLIMQLPAKQLSRLKEDLTTLTEKKKRVMKTNSFQEFLLHGPDMTESQYEHFQENRTYLNEWRKV